MSHAGPDKAAALYLLVRAAGFRVAVPAGGLLEVFRPETPATQLPRHRGALTAVVNFRGAALPLADLSVWLQGAAVSACPAPIVCVLSSDTRQLGLRVDGIDRLVTAGSQALQRLHHEADPEEFFHSTLDPGGGEARVPVLDVALLLARAQIWNAGGDAARTEENVGPTGSPARRPGEPRGWALLRRGDRWFGVPEASMLHVQPFPVLDPLHVGTEEVIGSLHWRGRVLAAADPLNRGGPAGPAPCPWLAILEGQLPGDGPAGALQLAVAVDGFEHLRDALGPLPVEGDAQAPLLLADGRAVHPLNTDALVARHGLPWDNTAPVTYGPHASSSDDRGPRNTETYLVFTAGHAMATPLSQLEEVLAVPHDILTGEPGREPRIRWRDQLIPLRAAGASALEGPGGRILVTRTPQGPVALRVDAVTELVPPRAGVLRALHRHGMGTLPLLIMRRHGTARTLRIVQDAGAGPPLYAEAS